MKKFYYLSALAALATTSAFAQYTIPEENAALQGDEYHMILAKSYDFATPAINGVAFDGSSITWAGEETSDFCFNSYKSVRCSTEGLESFWYQTAAPTWYSGKGLKNVNSGPRGFAMGNMIAGQILVVQGYGGGFNTAETSTFYNGYCVPNGANYSKNTGWAWQLADPLQVEDISEEINTANGIVEGEEYEGSPYLYLRVLNNGWVSLTLERYATICGVQVWNDATAEENISTPTVKIASVDEENRTWSWKPGESSLGNSVTTYYSFGENDPLFRDEDGNPVEKDGYYGDNYLEADEEIESLGANDEDIVDGILKLNIVSVTDNGVASEVATYEFDMSPIQLNAPTASLKSMDGKMRTYEISWTNNTLCGEEYTISYQTPNYEGTIELGEQVTIDDAPLTVTVEADGYAAGTLTIDELDVQGYEMHRKIEVTEENQHDWDFANLTLEQEQKMCGNYEIGVDEESEEPIFLDAGWYYDSSRGRAFRNCNIQYSVVDAEFDEDGTTITNTGSVEIDGVKGVNRVYDESDFDLSILGDEDPSTHLIRETCDGFVEDLTGIFDGLTISGSAPYINSSNVWASDFGYYILASNTEAYRGFWPTSNVTVTVPDLKAGDYVFYSVTGVVYAVEVPAEATSVSFSVAKSAYLNYIDIYTCDDETIGIDSAKATEKYAAANVYSIDGRLVKSAANAGKAVQGLAKGTYILNGKKFIVK